ncbi:hypothetical protein JCM17961_43050 [Endothiovibrio diazotrophicus]
MGVGHRHPGLGGHLTILLECATRIWIAHFTLSFNRRPSGADRFIKVYVDFGWDKTLFRHPATLRPPPMEGSGRYRIT